MIIAIQTGGSALTCIPSLRGHSRSAASLGLITQPTLCECNRSGLVSLKFPFAHSGWQYCCSVTLATQQWMRVLVGARPLLHNARHRTMPVNPPRLGLIHISPSYQTVYRSFEIILEWVLSIGLCLVCFFSVFMLLSLQRMLQSLISSWTCFNFYMAPYVNNKWIQMCWRKPKQQTLTSDYASLSFVSEGYTTQVMNF